MTLEVGIRADRDVLPGLLDVPPEATILVVFAHGSGSGRLSPRNAAVAEVLNRDGLATLLFDLLTEAEASDRRNVFDLGLLAERLLAALRAVRDRDDVGGLPIGLFGASTGGGAALVAAADPEARVASVVSRGGRPDLAGSALGRVSAPTLLVVGERDPQVLALNREAMSRMPRAEVRLEVVPGAGHLFEEVGALERVAGLASAWFRSHA